MAHHIWRLVPPAKPGNELDVATIDRRRKVVLAEYDEADEDDEEALLRELETLQMRRRALAFPPEVASSILS